MSDSLTNAVARLSRAASEYSKQTEKLRASVDTLLRWIQQNIELEPLPLDCKIYPSGEFIRTTPLNKPPLGSHQEILRLTIGQKHSIDQLQAFVRLIGEGFLDQFAEQLEGRAGRFGDAASKVHTFLAS
jgi:hypothetical protein